MKSLKFLLVFVAGLWAMPSMAQCDSLANLCGTYITSEYISDGQQYRALLLNEEVAELRAAPLVQRVPVNDAEPVVMTFERVDSLTVPGIDAPRSVVWLHASERESHEKGGA